MNKKEKKSQGKKTDRFELRTSESDMRDIQKLANRLNVKAAKAIRYAVKFALENMKKES